VYCSNNTPGFCFNAQNSQQWQYVGRAAFFNLEPPLRTTREVKRPKPQQSRRCGLWWKESSPWEDWFVTWQVFRISTNSILLDIRKNNNNFHALSNVCLCVFPTCNFFLEYNPRFSVAPFQKWPVDKPRRTYRRHTLTFLTKRCNVVLSFRTTRVRVPLARNPSPLQYPTLHVECISVRSLLRQPRSALEAGPS